jgi:hypothetical protein
MRKRLLITIGVVAVLVVMYLLRYHIVYLTLLLALGLISLL